MRVSFVYAAIVCRYASTKSQGSSADERQITRCRTRLGAAAITESDTNAQALSSAA